jgi:hypothetical protein
MKVYDILNAGPRHRFLIRNKDKKPLLVSNCTQAFAADIMAYGARTAESQWLAPFALIHDQALALQLDGQTPQQFASALSTLPPWAQGFPLKAEAKSVPYYSK